MRLSHESKMTYKDGMTFRPCRFAVLIILLLVAGCASAPPLPKTPKAPKPPVGEQAGACKILEEGRASFYADKFNGRRTASGEIFSNAKMTAAHKTLPFGTDVVVENSANGRTVHVRINDRGPFIKGRVIDLSKEAAREIDMIGAGVVPVTVWKCKS